MGLVLLKLVLTPILIGAASVAGRRWGAFIGGWLIALPLTSGPVTFFIALDQGPAFAANVAVGSLLGVAAIAAFAVAYARAGGATGAGRRPWRGRSPPSASSGLVAQPLVGLPVALLLVLVLASLLAAVRALPRAGPDGGPGPAPAWEIPARMLIGTAIVLVLTAAADALGAGLSGVVAIFPTFAAILTVFAHRRDGFAQAVAVLRGLLTGLYGTACFFVILIVALPPLGVAGGFALALAGCAVIQAAAAPVAAPARPSAGAGDPVDHGQVAHRLVLPAQGPRACRGRRGTGLAGHRLVDDGAKDIDQRAGVAGGVGPDGPRPEGARHQRQVGAEGRFAHRRVFEDLGRQAEVGERIAPRRGEAHVARRDGGRDGLHRDATVLRDHVVQAQAPALRGQRLGRIPAPVDLQAQRQGGAAAA